MKTEEAISILEQLFDQADELHENTNGNVVYWNQMKAIDIAIKSLKKEDGQDLEDIEKDTLIEQLKESNRELAHRLADLMTWRDHYKKQYERLLSEILDRVNVG